MANDNSNTLEEFVNTVLKLNGTRVHKITNSLGVYDAYKYIRKNKWLDLSRPVTEHEFYSIIREVNNRLAEEFTKGSDIKFPQRMGTIELRKYKATFSIKNGKVVTNLPIDWKQTLKLWYEDKIAYNNKTLVKRRENELFKVFYNKQKATYDNKCFYRFILNKELRKSLKRRVKDGSLDAFSFNKIEIL